MSYLIIESLLEIEFQRFNKALKNDGGDTIDQLRFFFTPIRANISNFSTLDTKFISHDSQIRQKRKLQPGFYDTA